MMCRNLKRRNVEGGKLDRLTNLPINIKYRIQEQLSVEEAARMSVLSTQWRYVWASKPKLVFSPQFCARKPLTDVIEAILSHHYGDIKSFCVDISSIPCSQHSVIDRWISFLSRNGITDLTLQNQSNALYKLPSCMYDIELESLRLSNCIFKLPCGFRGFHKLKNLTLHQVVLELNDVTPCLWMPYLVTLHVRECSGFPNSKVYAPRLSELFFFTRRTEDLELGHFMDCQKLKTVVLVSSKQNQHEVMNLTYLLKCWPEICSFGLDSCYFLKSFATEAERLPTYLNSLKSITLSEFDFDDDDHIFSLLRILTVSPHLVDLHLALNSKKKKTDDMKVINVVNHFEGPAYRTLGVLHKLQRLMINHFHGSKIEMFFVKFIFASAPVLLNTIIHEDVGSVDESQSLKISQELMSFPRASPKLKIHVNRLKMNMICRNIKRRNVEGEKLDRLSNLPINVKYRIQQQLSVEEAARMSVLSTPWRHVWASNPKLVFSPQFCQRKPLTDVIYTILLQHCGDIKTFSVNISSIPYSQHSVIDQWMLILSRNGVTDLTLQNQSNALYKLPSCIYDRELEGLRLSNCIFKPPCDFRGFHKLKNLTLHQVVLELNDVTSFLWMPYLVTLQTWPSAVHLSNKHRLPPLHRQTFIKIPFVLYVTELNIFFASSLRISGGGSVSAVQLLNQTFFDLNR
uniref:F-box domain-containing protein n=1 Tax=Solanum lycopersicum TaxID=4081 RepID=A0A3Q7GEV5_SOLLC